jgi:hypothetical protein
MTTVLIAVSNHYCMIFNAKTLMLEMHKAGNGFKSRNICAQNKEV